MDVGRRGGAGGIGQLRELISEHRSEVAHLCITHGLRLRDVGSPAFSWGDLWVLVKHAPEGSPLASAMHPARMWGWTDHLIAAVLDGLAGERVTRPWEDGPAEVHAVETAAMDEAEAEQWLAARRARWRPQVIEGGVA